MSQWRVTGADFDAASRAVFTVTKGSKRLDHREQEELEALLAGWQPIESAPKDGSMFICWVSAKRCGHAGMSVGASEADFCQWVENNGNGYFENIGGQIGDVQDITHWKPLTPPTTN